ASPLAAYRSFCGAADRAQQRAFATFVQRERRWLLPYVLFELLRERHDGAPWWEWPADVRRRSGGALRRLIAAERERFRAIAFQQYLFELSWHSLKRYAN